MAQAPEGRRIIACCVPTELDMQGRLCCYHTCAPMGLLAFGDEERGGLAPAGNQPHGGKLRLGLCAAAREQEVQQEDGDDGGGQGAHGVRLRLKQIVGLLFYCFENIIPKKLQILMSI